MEFIFHQPHDFPEIFGDFPSKRIPKLGGEPFGRGNRSRANLTREKCRLEDETPGLDHQWLIPMVILGTSEDRVVFLWDPFLTLAIYMAEINGG